MVRHSLGERGQPAFLRRDGIDLPARNAIVRVPIRLSDLEQCSLAVSTKRAGRVLIKRLDRRQF